jgi:hypothetical protein
MPIIKNFRRLLLLIFLVAFSIVSCEKEDTSDFVEQAKITAGYASAEDNMADLFVLFHKALHDTTLVNTGEATIDSAHVEFIQNSGPAYAEFIFDFGPDGKNCPDGKFRQGQISAVLSNSFDQPDAVFTANFENYRADSLLLKGQFSYKNTGEIVVGQLKYEIAIEVSFYLSNSKILTLSAQRDLFWKSGYDKPYNTINHVFVMPGGASALYYGYVGSVTPVSVLEVTITEDWTIQFSCFNPINKGYFEISLDDSVEVVMLNGEFVDVDDDGCSDKIIITNIDNSYGYPYYF